MTEQNDIYEDMKIVLNERQMILLIEQMGECEEVKAVQEALNKFFKKEKIEKEIPVDGHQTKQTDDALALFQKHHGITEENVFGVQTFTTMSNLGYLSQSKLEDVLKYYGL